MIREQAVNRVLTFNTIEAVYYGVSGALVLAAIRNLAEGSDTVQASYHDIAEELGAIVLSHSTIRKAVATLRKWGGVRTTLKKDAVGTPKLVFEIIKYDAEGKAIN